MVLMVPCLFATHFVQKKAYGTMRRTSQNLRHQALACWEAERLCLQQQDSLECQDRLLGYGCITARRLELFLLGCGCITARRLELALPDDSFRLWLHHCQTTRTVSVRLWLHHCQTTGTVSSDLLLSGPPE